MHLNTFTGKYYIGMSKNITERWKVYRYKGCKHFYNAIMMFGWENFKHIVILDNLTRSQAEKYERELIEKMSAITYGYNISEGGCGGKVYDKAPRNKKMTVIYPSGKVETFESMKQCATILDIDYRTLKNMVKKKQPYKVNKHNKNKKRYAPYEGCIFIKEGEENQTIP